MTASSPQAPSQSQSPASQTGALSLPGDAPLFETEHLSVSFETPDGTVEAVKRVSLEVAAGECLGVVGESGSGKSQLFLSALGLLAANGRVSGKVRFNGRLILGLPPRSLNEIRGEKIAMIFQDPLTSLTPHMRIGQQMTEVLRFHQGMARDEAENRALAMLERVRIPLAAQRLRQFPHELSGGMRQRVMIAMALLCNPALLIADEPTTALDVTVQAEILDLLRELREDLDLGVVLITHDMGVVAGLCDRVQVMQAGQVVETGTTEDVFYRPQEAYTKRLLAAMPRLNAPLPEREPPTGDAVPVLEARDLKVHFPVRANGGLFEKPSALRAVDGVSLKILPGETLGLVGESGCGKSTLARACLGLTPLTDGSLTWAGDPFSHFGPEALRQARARFQIVFQDPLASLDPRMTIGESIAEPLAVHAPELSLEDRRSRVRDMLARVGLDPRWINRYPHEFSGGQNQRVGIARGMILRPQLLVCDEVVSALDVSIQAEILALLADLQAEFGMAILFISHDLAVVRQVSDRVMVLFLGRVMELAPTATLFEDPRHPYTRSLLSAVPVPDPAVERNKKRLSLTAELPSPLDPAAAFTFLPSKRSLGLEHAPKLQEIGPGHFVAEHDPDEVLAGARAAA